MTEYQLKVLRAIAYPLIPRDDISKAIHNGYRHRATYDALDELLRMGYATSNGYGRWSRTPAGDVAIANAERRMLPRDPIESRLF